MDTNTLTPIAFFTPDITLVPHSLSTELAAAIEKPITVAEFQHLAGGTPVSLYVTGDWELVVRTQLPDGRELFAHGPEQFPEQIH